jgi:hypothetical protein
MGRNQHSFTQTGVAVLALIMLLVESASPAVAFRLPIGALASQQKLRERPGSLNLDAGKYNLSYVPLLLELARVLGRYQPGYGFFLRNEPFGHYPGIDLRWLLFNQSSPLSIDGMQDPSSGPVPAPAEGPTLAVPAIGDQARPPADSGKEALVPQLAVRPLPADANSYPLDESRARVGSPDQVSVALKGNELKNQPAVLMIDFRGLSAALHGIGDPNGEIVQTAWKAPMVRSTLAQPLPVPKTERTVKTGFLLWTLRPATAGSTASGQPNGIIAGSLSENSKYSGTFVACAQGARFKSLRPRHLTMQQGRVLAGNRGEELVFETGLGDLHLETGASALIDLSDKGVLRVIALESDDDARVSFVQKKLDSSDEVMNLGQGEELVLSDHELSNQEIQAAVDGIARNITSYGGSVARTRVSLSELLTKERLLDTGTFQLTDPQRSAIVQLRENLLEK